MKPFAGGDTQGLLYQTENPTKVHLKCQMCSGWATPPLMAHYVAESIHTQENINWAWSAEIAVS